MKCCRPESQQNCHHLAQYSLQLKQQLGFKSKGGTWGWVGEQAKKKQTNAAKSRMRRKHPTPLSSRRAVFITPVRVAYTTFILHTAKYLHIMQTRPLHQSLYCMCNHPGNLVFGLSKEGAGNKRPSSCSTRPFVSLQCTGTERLGEVNKLPLSLSSLPHLSPLC